MHKDAICSRGCCALDPLRYSCKPLVRIDENANVIRRGHIGFQSIEPTDGLA